MEECVWDRGEAIDKPGGAAGGENKKKDGGENKEKEGGEKMNQKDAGGNEENGVKKRTRIRNEGWSEG